MERSTGALVLMRYRWKDRHDDLVYRRNPWPLRVEFALIASLSLIGTVMMLISGGKWLLSLFG